MNYDEDINIDEIMDAYSDRLDDEELTYKKTKNRNIEVFDDMFDSLDY